MRNRLIGPLVYIATAVGITALTSVMPALVAALIGGELWPLVACSWISSLAVAVVFRESFRTKNRDWPRPLAIGLINVVLWTVLCCLTFGIFDLVLIYAMLALTLALTVALPLFLPFCCAADLAMARAGQFWREMEVGNHA